MTCNYVTINPDKVQELEEIINRTICIGIDDCHVERARKQHQRKQLKDRIINWIATL